MSSPKVNEYRKQYYLKNRERILASRKKYRNENREKLCAYNRQYNKEHKEYFKLYNKEYKQNNLKLYAHFQALRRLMLKQQTPPWADLDKIKEIYLNCPDGYEVDHIHPLSKGGLHIHYNLQHLPMSENRRKYNKIL